LLIRDSTLESQVSSVSHSTLFPAIAHLVIDTISAGLPGEGGVHHSTIMLREGSLNCHFRFAFNPKTWYSMTMLLNEVVPWGRSLREYRGMFALSPADETGRILGVGDGPASFNAEMTALGNRVVSIDPVYAFNREEIQGRVETTYKTVIAQVKVNPQRYKWDFFADADALGAARLEAMRGFLDDFETGLGQGRYRAEALPTLSFADGAFDLALCSHLLFLYSEQFSLEFHLASIAELLRVAREVRIFPLLGLDCQTSPHLEPVMTHFEQIGCSVDIVAVEYEFQVGGNQMLRLSGS